MLEDNLRRGKDHRTLGQKWKQIKAARELERAWSKPQILEAYLNLSTFRGELRAWARRAGVDGQAPSGLNERESLLLAVLVAAPTATPERGRARVCASANAFPTRRPPPT